MDEYVIVEKSSLNNIADTVRGATGSTDSIAVSALSNEVAAAITGVGGGGGLPTGGAPYQQLVTDGDGNAKWENRLAYRTGESITWDGDTTGLVQVSGAPLFKVSDRVFTAAELLGAEISFYANGNEQKIVLTENDISEDSGYIMIGEYAVSVSELSVPLGPTGTYFAKVDEATYVSGLRVGGSVVPMDMSFLPLNELESRFSFAITLDYVEKDSNGNSVYTSGITWDEFLSVYENNPGAHIIAIVPGRPWGVADKIYHLYEVWGVSAYFNSFDGYTLYFNQYAKPGKEFVLKKTSNAVPNAGSGDSNKYKIIQNIDSKWVDVFPDRIIMTSSTEGSTKKFKITVDDSGTISATEV